MNELSLSEINLNSPYKVLPAKITGYYSFTTDSGVKYTVGFDPDDLIMSDDSYQLIIVNVNNMVSPRDAKVKDTIISIIEEFFNKNNATMLYICETSDGKQAMRSRLFEYWFSSYAMKIKYTFLSTAIKDTENNTNFATLITRNDNPRFSSVLVEFNDTIRILREKPDASR